MEDIYTTLIIDDIINIESCYKVTVAKANQIFDWYQNFLETDEHIYISESIIISPKNFRIERHAEHSSNLLEFVPELMDGKIDSDSDEQLFTETENSMKLMDAHINGDIKQVNMMLNSVNNVNILNIIKKSKKI